MISIYPDHEENRLAALNSYNILDTANEKDFDDLTILASAICQTPIAFISLIDDKRQWFKSRKGISESETPIDVSFCVHTIASNNDIMIVEDANKDERFAENPLVKGEEKITFYAGVPLINEDGFALGSLCVVDQKQKQLTDEQTVALKIIAKQVVDKLELRKKAIELEMVNRN
jgi:GAF domain-containing protein